MPVLFDKLTKDQKEDFFAWRDKYSTKEVMKEVIDLSSTAVHAFERAGHLYEEGKGPRRITLVIYLEGNVEVRPKTKESILIEELLKEVKSQENEDLWPLAWLTLDLESEGTVNYGRLDDIVIETVCKYCRREDLLE